MVYIEKWPWLFGGDYPWWKYINRPLPGINEMRLLEERCSSIDAVAYMGRINNQLVKYKDNSVDETDVLAVSQNYNRIKTFELITCVQVFFRSRIEQRQRCGPDRSLHSRELIWKQRTCGRRNNHSRAQVNRDRSS